MGEVDKSSRLVQEAEGLVSEILRPGRWPQAATVERFLEGNRLERVLSLYSTAMELDPEEPAGQYEVALIPIALALRSDGSDPELVEAARKLVREIGRRKRVEDPPRELADELRRVPS